MTDAGDSRPADEAPPEPPAEEAFGGRPDALEWGGWAALAALTGAILFLAFLRPTDPGSIVNEIRLAAGFDRYEAAMQEGTRLFATARAELGQAGDDSESRASVLPVLAEAAERFQTAREEAEGFYEDQRAQNGIARVHLLWARELLGQGDRPWYRSDHEETLERARAIVDEALALPDITGDLRQDLEELGTRIDRAITPWPIL